ncbi:unnamed protein product [Sphagnum tenellum]
MNAICGDTTNLREAIIKFDTHRSERQSRIIEADLFTKSFVLWQIAFMVQPERIRCLLKKWEAYSVAFATKRKCRKLFRTASKAFACPHVRTTLGTRNISLARSSFFNVCRKQRHEKLARCRLLRSSDIRSSVCICCVCDMHNIIIMEVQSCHGSSRLNVQECYGSDNRSNDSSFCATTTPTFIALFLRHSFLRRTVRQGRSCSSLLCPTFTLQTTVP